MHFHRLAREGVAGSAGARSTLGFFIAGLLLGLSALGSNAGCGGGNTATAQGKDGGTGDGGSASEGGGGQDGNTSCGTTTLADDDYAGCATCTWSTTASPGMSMCTTGRSVNACCDWVQAPTATLTRAEGLHDYSVSNASPPDFSCLTTPPTAGAVHMGTLSGFVKVFSSSPPTGTVGVKVEVFGVNTTTGALSSSYGSHTTVSGDMTETNDWLNDCTGSPCTFYQYTIPNVPTETPLVIHTSDATGTGYWSDLYDYNIYFSDAFTCASAPIGAPCTSSSGGTWTSTYDVTAVANGDVQTAATTVGLTTLPSDGVIAGEVHDCGDVRISGANVDTDQAHDEGLFYFDANESNPLPDTSRSGQDLGTSALGLFGALNVATGIPVRVSAIGIINGKDTLLGTAIVQVYPNAAVTAVSLRGRRPYQ
jgi:hypothetical protein